VIFETHKVIASKITAKLTSGGRRLKLRDSVRRLNRSISAAPTFAQRNKDLPSNALSEIPLQFPLDVLSKAAGAAIRLGKVVRRQDWLGNEM